MNPNPDTLKPLPFYKSIGREIDVFEHAWRNQLPVLLKGPTGTGKSRLVEYMATKLKRPLISVACHEETSAVDLIGRYLIAGGETVWLDGPMTRAVRQGAILYLDEIAEARPDTMVAIHSLTDHRRALFVDRHNEELQAPPEFMLVASFNPDYQRGSRELKPSTRQRFIALSFQYPSPELEKSIIAGECGFEDKNLDRLVKLAERIRATSDLPLAETVSTRLLVDSARLIQSGLPARLACQSAIAEVLSDDAETLQALNELIALYF
ncbi:MAG: CbbQ/NirQ/NorQ/GpvN family protein [Leptospiraceae bacterium]|nr:CbbQ/NirQ/NorQ/GpvN family protein [Leptospiraceae bacterium]